jgi:hypothetical protein
VSQNSWVTNSGDYCSAHISSRWAVYTSMASFGLFLHHFIEMADTCGLLLTAGIIYATLFHADDVAAIECRGMHEDFSS